VPNEDFVYRRIHPTWQKGPGKLSTAAFTQQELSVDLASLTVAERTLRRGKDPDFGIAKLSVHKIRVLPVNEKFKQEVEHAPRIFNWAHTHVNGKKTDAVKKRLTECAEMVIDTKAYRLVTSPQTMDSRPLE
jgi:hypothetical protein